jgi:putative transposase
MSHSYNKLWIHAVLVTKFRMPLIEAKIESKVYSYLREELKKMKCQPTIINGVSDHIHILFILNPDKSVADVMKQLKGGSSYFINSGKLISAKFQWNRGYGAFSVSHSGSIPVFNYIKKQKQRHKKVDIGEEIKSLVALHGLTYDWDFFESDRTAGTSK